MYSYLTEVITLWVVIDPIGTLPVFLAVSAGKSAAVARRIAVRATLIAFGILLFFIAGGQLLFQVMDIRLSSFQIAGGIVLFLFALTMIFGETKVKAETEEVRTSDLDHAVYPLAVPSIASPGAMLAVVTLTDNTKVDLLHQLETVVQLSIILAITLGLMLAAAPIIRVIGDSGASVVSRVMGLILASVAVDAFVKGVEAAMAG